MGPIRFFGETGDDVLIGGAGDDALDGGAGVDDAVYTGSVRDYAIARSVDGFVVRDMARGRHGDDGADLVRGVERLRFLDRTVFLDGANNAPLLEQDEGFVVADGRTLRIRASELLANDRDFDGDRLTIVGVSFDVKGSATAVTDPSGRAVRIVGNSVVYTPAEGFQWATLDQDSYEDTFFYTVSDGRGGVVTQSATLTIARPGAVVASSLALAPASVLDFDVTTTATFDETESAAIAALADDAPIVLLAAPVAVDDAFTTNEDTAANFNVLLNDSDPDADPLSVTSVNVTGTLGVVYNKLEQHD